MIIEFVLAAEQEFDEAVAYFDTQRAGLGHEFATEIDAAIRRILEHPNAWQRVAPGLRRYQLRRFEYGIVYRVRGSVVTIYAVMHFKRKPNYWRKRMK